MSLPIVGTMVETSRGTYEQPFGYYFGTTSYTGGVSTFQQYYTSDGYVTSTTYYIPRTLTSIIFTGDRICDHAFNNCNNITNFTIGENVTYIGDYAFSGCNFITEINIPASVTSIGCAAFNGHFSSISVDSNNPSYRSIDGNLFSKDGGRLIAYATAKEDTTFVIPETITCIDIRAFEYASNLKQITIPATVTEIGSRAFYGCWNIIIFCETEAKPDGWDEKWNWSGRPVVWGCIDFGITDDGFEWGSTQDGIVITKYSGNDTEIAIPEEINGIAVISVPDRAFENKSTLKSILIPESITKIGYYAFVGCSNITIYCEATSKPDGWDTSWNPSSRPVVWGYTGEEYTYSFVTNGGDEISPVTSDQPITLITPTRSGYHFDGWFDNENLEGEAISGPYYSQSVHTLYAKWITEEEYQAFRDGTSFDKAFIITSGQSLPAVIDTNGEYVYFKFTATASKTYSFKSSGTYDTYGYLYNSTGSQLSSNDDGAGSGNFLISRYISVGETVYIGARMYSSSTKGTFTVSVS